MGWGSGIWIQGVKKAPYPGESDPQHCFFRFIDSAFLTFQVLSELEQLDEEARFENGVLSSFYWVLCVCVCAEWNIGIVTVCCICPSHMWNGKIKRAGSPPRFDPPTVSQSDRFWFLRQLHIVRMLTETGLSYLTGFSRRQSRIEKFFIHSNYIDDTIIARLVI